MIRDAIADLIVSSEALRSFDAANLTNCTLSLMELHNGWLQQGVTQLYREGDSIACAKAFAVMLSKLFDHFHETRRRLNEIDLGKTNENLSVEEVLEATRTSVELEATTHLLPGDYIIIAFIAGMCGGDFGASGVDTDVRAAITAVLEANGFRHSNRVDWHACLSKDPQLRQQVGFHHLNPTGKLQHAVMRIAACWMYGDRWPVLLDPHGISGECWWSHAVGTTIFAYSNDFVIEAVEAALARDTIVVIYGVPSSIPDAVNRAFRRSPDAAGKLLLVCPSATIPSWCSADALCLADLSKDPEGLSTYVFHRVLEAVAPNESREHRELLNAESVAAVDVEQSKRKLYAATSAKSAADLRFEIKMTEQVRDAVAGPRQALGESFSPYSALRTVALAIIQSWLVYDTSATASSCMDKIVAWLRHFGQHGLCQSEAALADDVKLDPFVQWLNAAGDSAHSAENVPGAKLVQMSIAIALRALSEVVATPASRHGMVASAHRVVQSGAIEPEVAYLLVFMLAKKFPSDTLPNEVNLLSAFQRLSMVLQSSAVLLRMHGDPGATTVPTLPEYLEWLDHHRRIAERLSSIRDDLNLYISEWMFVCSPLNDGQLIDTGSVASSGNELLGRAEDFEAALGEFEVRRSRIHLPLLQAFDFRVEDLKHRVADVWAVVQQAGGKASPQVLLEQSKPVAAMIVEEAALQKEAAILEAPFARAGVLIMLKNLCLPKDSDESKVAKKAHGADTPYANSAIGNIESSTL